MNVTLTVDDHQPPLVTIHTAPGLDPFAVLTITDSRGSKVHLEALSPDHLARIAIAARMGAADLQVAQAMPALTEEDVPL